MERISKEIGEEIKDKGRGNRENDCRTVDRAIQMRRMNGEDFIRIENQKSV